MKLNLEKARVMLDQVKAYADNPETVHQDEFDKAEALYVALEENINGSHGPEYRMLCELQRVFNPGMGCERHRLSGQAFEFLNELVA